MSPKRIVVTGDLLRPDDKGRHHSQTTNILWLHSLLSHQIEEATGIVPVAVTNESGEFDFSASYDLVNTISDPNGWASLYDEAPAALQALWAQEFSDALCIGFEMPPSMRSALTNAGIPYIDIMMHPVRFMDDIFLGLRSNSPEITATIAEQALPERLCYRAAGAVRGFAARKGWVPREKPFTLIAGQVEVDRSLIVDGKFLTSQDLISPMRKLLGETDRVLFAKHPFAKTNSLFDLLRKKKGRVEKTDRNSYGLLSSPSLQKVISVSSSLGTEAKYFGRDAAYVLGPSTPVLYRGDEDDGLSYWSVYNAFLVPDFWRRVLKPVLATTPPDGDEVFYRMNYLRSSLRAFWGFKAIAEDSGSQ